MDSQGARIPTLIAVGGWVATGKSTLARLLATALGARLIVADEARGELRRRRDERSGSEASILWNLSPGVSDEVYEEMIHRAEPMLRRGFDVVLDGCFASRRHRIHARELAARCGAGFHLLICRAPRAVIEQRLSERSEKAGVPCQAWDALFDELVKRWESPDELDKSELTFIATGETPEKSLRSAQEALCGRIGPVTIGPLRAQVALPMPE